MTVYSIIMYEVISDTYICFLIQLSIHCHDTQPAAVDWYHIGRNFLDVIEMWSRGRRAQNDFLLNI